MYVGVTLVTRSCRKNSSSWWWVVLITICCFDVERGKYPINGAVGVQVRCCYWATSSGADVTLWQSFSSSFFLTFFSLSTHVCNTRTMQNVCMKQDMICCWIYWWKDSISNHLTPRNLDGTMAYPFFPLFFVFFCKLCKPKRKLWIGLHAQCGNNCSEHLLSASPAWFPVVMQVC